MSSLPERAVVADIGGTNARFALADLGSLELSEPRESPCSAYPTLAAAMRAYLDAAPNPPTHAAIAVAAPCGGRGDEAHQLALVLRPHRALPAAGSHGLRALSDHFQVCFVAARLFHLAPSCSPDRRRRARS